MRVNPRRSNTGKGKGEHRSPRRRAPERGATRAIKGSFGPRTRTMSRWRVGGRFNRAYYCITVFCRQTNCKYPLISPCWPLPLWGLALSQPPLPLWGTAMYRSTTAGCKMTRAPRVPSLARAGASHPHVPHTVHSHCIHPPPTPFFCVRFYRGDVPAVAPPSCPVSAFPMKVRAGWR